MHDLIYFCFETLYSPTSSLHHLLYFCFQMDCILCFLFILSCDWACFVCKAFLCDSCAGLQVFGIVKIL